jgi:hypothetical protein
MTSITFFFATWEEYLTERLDLPCIHGVSEGTYIAVSLIITTAFTGQDIWKTLLKFGSYSIQCNQLVLYLFFTFSMLFSIARLINA